MKEITFTLVQRVKRSYWDWKILDGELIIVQLFSDGSCKNDTIATDVEKVVEIEENEDYENLLNISYVSK